MCRLGRGWSGTKAPSPRGTLPRTRRGGRSKELLLAILVVVMPLDDKKSLTVEEATWATSSNTVGMLLLPLL